MAPTSAYMFYLVCVCFYVGVKAASIATYHTADGFWVDHFMAGRTFSYGCVPSARGEDMALSFYDVDIASSDCDDVRVDVYDDGYVKTDYNRIAIICDKASLDKFTAVSKKGFHVVITMGSKVVKGSIKASFKADNGLRITNELLYSS